VLCAHAVRPAPVTALTWSLLRPRLKRMYSYQPTCIEVNWSRIKLSFIAIHFNILNWSGYTCIQTRHNWGAHVPMVLLPRSLPCSSGTVFYDFFFAIPLPLLCCASIIELQVSFIVFTVEILYSYNLVFGCVSAHKQVL
jgi:hypothetical protein